MNNKIIGICKKITAIMFIAAGIIIIAFPWAKAWYFTSIQNKVMRLWQESVSNGEIRFDSEYTERNVPDEKLPDAIDENIDTDGGVWVENANRSFDLEYVKNNMEGIITIDKINLSSPILKNATAYNLDISICSVAGCGKMGEAGNYVLAGHKSRIYGRHFNRLAEVSAGDKVIVEDGVNVYEYTVTEIISVEPTETRVMDSDGEKKLLTLITCDYRTNPVNRLVVKCELEEP